MGELGRILIVEDDQIIREVLAGALEDEGYAVYGVTHGREALDLLREWPADLIVLDLMLPVMDGGTFLLERRRLGLAPGVPVVVLSASRRTLDSGLFEAGADMAVAKPFDLEHLLSCIRTLLASAGTRGGQTRAAVGD